MKGQSSNKLKKKKLLKHNNTEALTPITGDDDNWIYNLTEQIQVLHKICKSTIYLSISQKHKSLICVNIMKGYYKLQNHIGKSKMYYPKL